MDIKPIKTEADNERVLVEIDGLMAAAADTSEGDRLDVLVTLVEAYEDRHHWIAPPDPVEAIRFRMEQSGRRQADLAALLGSRSRASEVLNRRRPLTMTMVWRLHEEWGIPAESLIRPYEMATS
jgi:HTH-type transcriptional regulator/antitoxin HigA